MQTLWEGEVPSEPPLRQQPQNRIHREWLTTSGDAFKKGVILLFRKRGQSKNQNDPFSVCPLFWSVGLGLWAGLGRQFFDQVFDRAGVFDSLGTGIDQVAGDAVLLAEFTQFHPEVR